MRRDRRCAQGTTEVRESLSLYPNIRTASAAGSRTLKLSCTLRFISPRMNPTLSGLHADIWSPFFIVFSRASLDQDGSVLTETPYFR